MTSIVRFRPSKCVALLLAALIAGASAVWAQPSHAYEPKDLPQVEAKVRADYPTVPQLSDQRFQSMIESGEPTIVFDVREDAEYRVSRIGDAVRADPSQWASTFVRRHGDDVAGKTVVFYCSVGVRSSKLAARVQDELKSRGAKAVYNLEGGIFRWHNGRRSLMGAAGATEAVHPYDSNWGGLVERRDLTRYQP